MGARYHPGVIWGPFVLALALGLVVSAGLYFAYLWPQVEPDEDVEAVSDGGGGGDGRAAQAEAVDDTKPATDAKPATQADAAEAPAPASESSPA